jgi:hypothetical protein
MIDIVWRVFSICLYIINMEKISKIQKNDF